MNNAKEWFVSFTNNNGRRAGATFTTREAAEAYAQALSASHVTDAKITEYPAAE